VTGRRWWNAWKWKGEPYQGYSDFYKTIVPLWVRRRGGYVVMISDLPTVLRSIAWTSARRTHNWWMDLQDHARGYCVESPWPTQGGYSFWRCDQGIADCIAAGEHRSNNYVWSRFEGGGSVRFEPLELGGSLGRARLRHRHPVRSFRQEREWKRMMARAEQIRRYTRAELL